MDGGRVLSNSSGLKVGPNDILFLSDLFADPFFLRIDGVLARRSFSGVFSFCFTGVLFDNFSCNGTGEIRLSFSSRTAAEILLNFEIEVLKESPVTGVLGLPWTALSGVCREDKSVT